MARTPEIKTEPLFISVGYLLILSQMNPVSESMTHDVGDRLLLRSDTRQDRGRKGEQFGGNIWSLFGATHNNNNLKKINIRFTESCSQSQREVAVWPNKIRGLPVISPQRSSVEHSPSTIPTWRWTVDLLRWHLTHYGEFIVRNRGGFT